MTPRLLSDRDRSVAGRCLPKLRGSDWSHTGRHSYLQRATIRRSHKRLQCPPGHTHSLIESTIDQRTRSPTDSYIGGKRRQHTRGGGGAWDDPTRALRPRWSSRPPAKLRTRKFDEALRRV